MHLHPQTLAALAIVLVTLAIFVVRIFFRPKPKGGCGHDCGCGKSTSAPPFQAPARRDPR